MKCTVCNHSQRHDIDRALLAGNATFAALSQQYRLSVSALFRHKKLLKLKIAQVEKDLLNNLRQDCLFQYNEYLETTRQIVRTASSEGNSRQTLQAVRAGTRILNFITKLDVQLDQDTVYRILASPQWLAQDSLLPTGSKIITDGHQTLADDLFFPCAELPATLEDALQEEEKSELSTPAVNQACAQPVELRARTNKTRLIVNGKMQTVFDQIPETVPADETLPKIQRETSAKLPKKTPRLELINPIYQEDMPGEKNTAPNPVVGRESAAPPAVKQSGSHPVEPHAQKNDPRQTELGKPETVFASQAPPIIATPSPQPVLGEASPPPGSTLSAGVGLLPLDISPDSPPKTVNQKSETRTAKLKTYCQRWPRLVSNLNRKPKTNKRLLPDLITSLNSWFQSLATKCRPDPPPAPYEEEWEILRIQKSDRRYRGIY